ETRSNRWLVRGRAPRKPLLGSALKIWAGSSHQRVSDGDLHYVVRSEAAALDCLALRKSSISWLVCSGWSAWTQWLAFGRRSTRMFGTHEPSHITSQQLRAVGAHAPWLVRAI